MTAAAGMAQGNAARLTSPPPRPAARVHQHRHSHQRQANFLTLCLRTCALWSPAVLGTGWSIASSAAKRCSTGACSLWSSADGAIGGNLPQHPCRAAVRSGTLLLDQACPSLPVTACLGRHMVEPARPADVVVCMQTCAGARSMSFLCRADGTDGLDYAYLSSLPGAPGGSALCILLSGLAALKHGPV